MSKKIGSAIGEEEMVEHCVEYPERMGKTCRRQFITSKEVLDSAREVVAEDATL